MRLPQRKIIEVWPPDEAGEVLGVGALDRCPTMKLPKGKIIEGLPPDEAGEVLGALGHGAPP